MKINLAHIRIGTSSVAIFDADATSHTFHDRQLALVDLTARARNGNLRVDQSALVFTENGRPVYFGDPDLVQHLTRNPVSFQWTHQVTH